MDTKTINLRDLPEEFVRRAKVQAAMSGMTLKDFVIKAVEKAIQEGLPASAKRRRKKQ
jgi:predicted HicB family RNase H-like nuclease